MVPGDASFSQKLYEDSPISIVICIHLLTHQPGADVCQPTHMLSCRFPWRVCTTVQKCGHRNDRPGEVLTAAPTGWYCGCEWYRVTGSSMSPLLHGSPGTRQGRLLWQGFGGSVFYGSFAMGSGCTACESVGRMSMNFTS